MVKRFVRAALKAAGLKVEWRDRLLETMHYQDSPYLPRVHAYNMQRILYFRDMLETCRAVDGDIVECGTSVGHSLLTMILICDAIGTTRRFLGFDSFEGFPAPTADDAGTHVTEGFLSSPPEVVRRVLRDGGVSDDFVRQRVQLVKGFFERTVPHYDGQIALLHLDCDLYDSYTVTLRHLYPKVVPGGVLMFDEYHDRHFPGATKAVDEFFADKVEKPRQHPLGRYYVLKAHAVGTG